MKLLWILALIINVANYGEIPAEGMNLTVTEATQDPLTGKMQIGVEGTLSSSEPVSVTITRSANELTDEFCCAGQCIFGNGETTQTMEYDEGNDLRWYAHYVPAPNSNETIQYTFTSGNESRTLTVNYIYGTQGLDEAKVAPKHICIFRLSDGKQLIKEIKK